MREQKVVTAATVARTPFPKAPADAALTPKMIPIQIQKSGLKKYSIGHELRQEGLPRVYSRIARET